MSLVFRKTKMLTGKEMHYCPGCTHGIIHRLVAEALDELGAGGSAIGVAPVGCAVFAYEYFNCDMHEAAHGRAPAVATGIKRVHPDNIVFTYQGDGDLASIGAAEIVHAAARGENITVIFINNAIYGMTGGQMAPTTLVGQRTSTTPKGRHLIGEGPPLRVCELLSPLERVVYLERRMLTSPKEIRLTKKAIERAFRVQQQGLGFSMVEILSPCPTHWRLPPEQCAAYIEDRLTPVFPVGVIKDTTSAARA